MARLRQRQVWAKWGQAMNSRRTPYRIVVFATGLIGRRKKATGYGYMGWNPHQAYQEARLPSAGSFLYPGLHAVRDAAMHYLQLPETHQVSIRTNQDRPVYRFYKDAVGRMTGYGDTDR